MTSFELMGEEIHTLLQKYSSFINANIKSISSNFSSKKMICKNEKLPLVTEGDEKFRLPGDCYCSVLADPYYCSNSPHKAGKFHLHQLLVKDSYI